MTLIQALFSAKLTLLSWFLCNVEILKHIMLNLQSIILWRCGSNFFSTQHTVRVNLCVCHGWSSCNPQHQSTAWAIEEHMEYIWSSLLSLYFDLVRQKVRAKSHCRDPAIPTGSVPIPLRMSEVQGSKIWILFCFQFLFSYRNPPHSTCLLTLTRDK